jgi:hypothetical protein
MVDIMDIGRNVVVSYTYLLHGVVHRAKDDARLILQFIDAAVTT